MSIPRRVTIFAWKSQDPLLLERPKHPIIRLHNLDSDLYYLVGFLQLSIEECRHEVAREERRPNVNPGVLVYLTSQELVPILRGSVTLNMLR